MKWVLVLTVVLMFFQYRSTKPTDFRRLTETEKITQLRRMNEYSPATYRLANLIEARPESIIYFKLEKNFVDIFDPLLFSDSFTGLALLPFFLLGLFEAIKSSPKSMMLLMVLPVALLTVVGGQNPYGPISLFPLIFFCAAFGFTRVIKRILKTDER